MIKNILLISLVLKTIYEEFLYFISFTTIDKELPSNIKDMYNEEEYKRWKEYQKEGKWLQFLEDMLEFIILFCFLYFDIYAKIFYFLHTNDYIQYLFLIVISSIGSIIISIPFDYYDTFVIEEKYGFNKTTKKTYILDKIKGFFISVFLAYVILIIVKTFFDIYGFKGVIYIMISMLLLSLIIILLIIPIMKIFNKFTPLENEELKNKLTLLCEKYNVKVKKIVVKDASRRTTKSNAFCTGLGKMKTISLDDNLVKNYTENQIVAVFAHEFAHARFKHMLKLLPLSIIRIIINVFFVGILLTYNDIFMQFGFDSVNYIFAFNIYGYLTWIIDEVLDAFSNYISRRHEYEADAFAAKEGYGKDLISSLKKLCKESLSDVNPHSLIVMLDYSHPTLSQRISAIEKNM